MSLPRGHRTKVPKKNLFREISEKGRKHLATAVQTKGNWTAGEERDAGSCPHGPEYPAQVQRRYDVGVSEGKERDTNPPGVDENEGDAVRAQILVARVLREHSGLGRAANSRLCARARTSG